MYKWMVRVTSVGSAPSSLLSGRFMWVDLQLEASSETARINVIQWQLHSDEGLPLWRVHAHIAGVSPPTHRPGCPPTSRSAAGHGCSSALLSGEHCWSGGLRYCWLMSLILPAFFLNALLLPSPRLPLPALSLSLSLFHAHTGALPPPLPLTHDVMQARSPIATVSPITSITPITSPLQPPPPPALSGIADWCKRGSSCGRLVLCISDWFIYLFICPHFAPQGAKMKRSTLDLLDSHNIASNYSCWQE